MNLNEIRENVMQIIACAQLLEKNYKSKVTILENIYNIVRKNDSPLIRKLEEVIGKYKSSAQISKSYLEQANRVIQYIDDSNSNIDNLTSSLTQLIRDLNIISIQDNDDKI